MIFNRSYYNFKSLYQHWTWFQRMDVELWFVPITCRYYWSESNKGKIFICNLLGVQWNLDLRKILVTPKIFLKSRFHCIDNKIVRRDGISICLLFERPALYLVFSVILKWFWQCSPFSYIHRYRINFAEITMAMTGKIRYNAPP